MMITLQQVNWFDAIICGVVALSVVVSLFRGFVREAISLLIWILALVLGLKFTPRLGDDFAVWIKSETLAYVLAFVGIFVLVLLFGILLNLCLRALIDKAGLGIVDRFLGVCFGAVRGGLLVVVVLLFVELSPLQRADWYRAAALPHYFTPAVLWVGDYVPSRLKQVTQSFQLKIPDSPSP